MVTLSNNDPLFNGSNTDITVLTGSTVSVNGDDNTVDAASADTMSVLGYGNTIWGSYDTMTVGNDGGIAANVVNGSDDLINVLGQAHVVVNGIDNTINQNSGFITISGAAGGYDILNGTVLETTVLPNTTVYAGGVGVIAFYLGAGDVVNASGDDDSFEGSGDRILISGAYKGGDSVDGDNNRVFLGSKSLLDLSGSGNYVRLATGAALNVTGSGQRLAGAGMYLDGLAGADFWVGGNSVNEAPDLVAASNCVVRIGADSFVSMAGDDDVLGVRAGATFAVEGTGLTIHAGQGASVMVTGNGVAAPVDTVTGANFNLTINSTTNARLSTFATSIGFGNHVVATMNRADNTVTAGNSDTLSILWGDANVVTPGLDDAIYDGGSGTLFRVDNGIGATTISGIGSADPGGVIELLKGIGSFNTAQDAYNALTSDGAGGVKLGLNIYGSIDFAGTSMSQLSAANFKIG
jgi:hypothetical protein